MGTTAFLGFEFIIVIVFSQFGSNNPARKKGLAFFCTNNLMQFLHGEVVRHKRNY